MPHAPLQSVGELGQQGSLLIALWSASSLPTGVAGRGQPGSGVFYINGSSRIHWTKQMGHPMAKKKNKKSHGHGYPLVIYDVFSDARREYLDASECLLQQM